ncbi:MAG TPA: hypothetical protein VGE69_11725 [Pseudomonadales bacterium]
MNMSNKVVPAAIALSLASTPLAADTEFGAEVPRAVVEQFIGNPLGGESKLYSDIFTAFPPFALPAGFDVVASADQGIQQRAILRTSLAPADARALIVPALVAEGWIEMSYGAAAPRTGFVVLDAPATQPVSLCHDTLGRMSLFISDAADGRYVNLSRTTMAALGGARRTCAEEAQIMSRADGPFRGPGGVREYLPALVMPPSDVTAGRQPAIFSSGGGGGSSNDFETRGFLSITWDGRALMEHFAPQLAEQGWAPDTQVSGTKTAFGSWTKTIDGNALLGLLTLVETGDDAWDLKFRVVRGGSAPADAVRSEVTR